MSFYLHSPFSWNKILYVHQRFPTNVKPTGSLKFSARKKYISHIILLFRIYLYLIYFIYVVDHQTLRWRKPLPRISAFRCISSVTKLFHLVSATSTIPKSSKPLLCQMIMLISPEIPMANRQLMTS